MATTIKALLQNLLDAHLKSEKKWVSEQSSFRSHYISIVPYPGTSGNIDIDYVPPADGWVLVDDNGSNVDLYIQGAILSYSGKGGATCRRSIFAPVIKGGMCKIRGKGEDVYIILVPLYGQQ